MANDYANVLEKEISGLCELVVSNNIGRCLLEKSRQMTEMSLNTSFESVANIMENYNE